MNVPTAIALRTPSAFDGRPVKVVLSGLVDGSSNTKTGPMIQSYILPDGVHPVEAQKTGADATVCGDCPARKVREGWCYVTPFPMLTIARLEREGKLPLLTAHEVLAAVEGRPLRLGAYGDPAAVPYDWWRPLVDRASMWTGYTHAWRTCDQRFRLITMASVETLADAQLARERGWRTFRTRPTGGVLAQNEIVCPAETRGVTCAACKLCKGGALGKSIAIDAHGALATRFLQPRLFP